MDIVRALFVSLLSLTSGCSNDSSSDPVRPTGAGVDASDLTGPVWELDRYTGADGELQDVLPVTTFQLRLEPESARVRSFSQCKSQSGSYELGDGFVVIRLDGPVDAVVCDPADDPTFAEEERTVRTVLDGPAFGEGGEPDSPLMYLVEDGILELSTPDARRLVFVEVDAFEEDLPGGSSDASAVLLGRTWNWYGYQAAPDGEIESIDDVSGSYTLRFSTGGSLGGTVDCNSWSGSWTGPGVSLRITDLIATEIACDSDKPGTEELYLRTLEEANGLVVSPDDELLTITSAGGTRLLFSAAPLSPVVGQWTLSSYTLADGTSRFVPDDIEVGIEILPERTLEVRYDLCDSYETFYRLNGDVLTTADPAFPEVSCDGMYADADSMERRELARRALMNTRTTVAVSGGDVLTVTTERNEVLLFERVSEAGSGD